MISAAEASTIISDSVRPLETITISLDRCIGKALGEDVCAGENVPPFDNAGMDGFAVRSTDTQKLPARLTVVGELQAGSLWDGKVRTGEALSIMTGATIPPGADAVVQFEWTRKISDTAVEILRSVESGHNIRPAGSDIRSGTLVMQKGQTLRPQEIGILASLGRQFVVVYRAATVGILTTGNELVDITRPLKSGTIRNSNAYLLRALVQESGAEPNDIGIARDTEDDLMQRIIEGLKTDVLVTSGGVSAGRYDLVVDVLKKLHAEVKFWKVNIKPGMPMVFAICRERPVFGLPGNPVSGMVTFSRFVKPALRRMMGHSQPGEALMIRATLEHDLEKQDGKRHFVRGILTYKGTAMTVQTTGSQASNILTSISKANCLIILPEESRSRRAGDEVEVELL